ncbi:hypothetical protein F5X97DRAFT_341359 [Nemania serpens]|nr:hypothetical protein F5X97DRAFT_341359 [Nemania serpens]
MAAEQFLGFTEEQQLRLVRSIWPSITENAFQRQDYTRLFIYINGVMKNARKDPDRYPKHTVDEIAKYIQFLRENIRHSKAEVIIKIQTSDGTDDHIINQTLDLAASAWLTISVNTEKPSEGPAWNRNETLQQSIGPHFKSVTAVDSTRRDIIPRSLTMANFCKNYGFTVNWTSDLRRHLNIDWENQRITVYEHMIYLCNYVNHSAETPIPIGILEEALDTINLLFPSDQKRTRKFLKNKDKTFHRLGYCGRERRMRLSDYGHWGKQIGMLRDVLDDPPKGYHQLVLDKEHRNFLNWATFWIAFLVALLTVISIAFGIVGVVYGILSYAISVKSYQVAVESLNAGIQQLELAIAMACGDAETAARLPQYCSGT